MAVNNTTKAIEIKSTSEAVEFLKAQGTVDASGMISHPFQWDNASMPHGVSVTKDSTSSDITLLYNGEQIFQGPPEKFVSEAAATNTLGNFFPKMPTSFTITDPAQIVEVFQSKSRRERADAEKAMKMARLIKPQPAHHDSHGDAVHDHHHSDIFHINTMRIQDRIDLARKTGMTSRFGPKGLQNIYLRGKAFLGDVMHYGTLGIYQSSPERQVRALDAHSRHPAQINPEQFENIVSAIRLEGDAPYQSGASWRARTYSQAWNSWKKRRINETMIRFGGSGFVKCYGDRYIMSGYNTDGKLQTITVRRFEDLYREGFLAGIIQPSENFLAGKTNSSEATKLKNFINFAAWNARIQEMATHRSALEGYPTSDDALSAGDLFDILSAVRKCFNKYDITADDRAMKDADFHHFVEHILDHAGADRAIERICRRRLAGRTDTQMRANIDSQKAWLRHFLAKTVGEDDNQVLLDRAQEATETPKGTLMTPKDGDKRWNYPDFVAAVQADSIDVSVDVQDSLRGLIGGFATLDGMEKITEGLTLYFGPPERPLFTMKIFKHGVAFHKGPSQDTRTLWEIKADTNHHHGVIAWDDVPHHLDHMFHEVDFHHEAGIGFFAGQLTEVHKKIQDADPSRILDYGNIKYDEAGLLQQYTFLMQSAFETGRHTTLFRPETYNAGTWNLFGKGGLIYGRSPLPGKVFIAHDLLQKIANICRARLGQTPINFNQLHEDISSALVDLLIQDPDPVERAFQKAFFTSIARAHISRH